MAYAILKLKEVPACCIDCPLNYDNYMCKASLDTSDYWEDGHDPNKSRLPDCPLEIHEEN